MQLYLSGSMGRTDYKCIERLLELDGYRLCTFAYPTEAFVYLDMAEELGYSGVKMMIDSGAFTAWRLGKPVKLEKLIRYNLKLLEKYGDRHEFVFIGLDVIPGKLGRKPSGKDLIDGMNESYANYLKMQEAIPRPVLPVYHSSEPTEFRDLFLKHTNHICLSMNQKMGEKHRVDWATRVQVPGAKMHGLAATGNQMIRYVDWYSVDSAAWTMVAAMGMIYWPTPNGLFNLRVSSSSPAKKQQGAHAESMTMTKEIMEIIESKGVDIDLLQNDYKERMLWNLNAWSLNDWVRTPVHTKGLFHD